MYTRTSDSKTKALTHEKGEPIELNPKEFLQTRKTRTLVESNDENES